MANKINVLINEYTQIPILIRHLRTEGIPINDITIVHKRADRLKSLFINDGDQPQIIDDDVRPFLRRMEVSEHDIDFCESRVNHGGSLLILSVPDNSTERVTALLQKQNVLVPSSDQMAIGHVLPKGTVMGRAGTGLSRLDKIHDVRFRVSSFDPTGWKVTDPEGDKIGDIDYLIGNPTTGVLLLVAIDCGGLFKDKHVLVPFDRFQFDFHDKEAQLPFDREQVKKAPSFSSKETDYYKFSTYWDEIPARNLRSIANVKGM